MDGLEHGRDLRALGLGGFGQHVAVEVDRVALVGRPREHLGGRADHAHRLVAREHANPAQPARLEPREKHAPAPRRLREALGGPDDLAVAVVVDAYGDHHGDVLAGTAPAAFQVDAVDADVGIGPLERAVAPLLDRRERLLVQIGDGRGRGAGAPEHLAHVLDPPRRDPRQVHLGHRLLDARLATPVALDDGGGEPYALELGHANRDLAGRSDRAPVVVAGAVRLASGGPLVALGADEVSGLFLEQAVERVLHGPPDELPQVGLQGLLIQRCDGLGHGLPPACFFSRQSEIIPGRAMPSFLT